MKAHHNILRKLKVHPFDIANQLKAKLKTNKTNKIPPWLSAITLAPQPSLQLRSVIQHEHGLFAQPTHNAKVPPLIEYPEDKLRKTFYQDHPFELDRSVTIEDSPKIWTDIYAGRPKTKSSLTGEKY
jgi:hypothetical protein